MGGCSTVEWVAGVVVWVGVIVRLGVVVLAGVVLVVLMSGVL